MARRLIRSIIVFAFVVGFVTTSYGFDAGPVKINAGVKVKEMSDSNIYSTPDNEIEDTITVISPSLDFVIESKRHRFNLGISSDASMYADNSDEDFTSVQGKAGYILTSLAGVSFKISDTYMTSKDPRPEQNAPEMKEHSTNTIDSSFVYTFPSKKFALEVFAKEFQLEYDLVADEDLNRKDREYGAGVYYRVLPKTSLLIEYSYGDKEYYDKTDEEYDSSSNFYRLGIKWDASAKMNGSVKIGFEDRVYDNATDALGNNVEHEKKHSPAIETDIAYNITKDTKLKLTVKSIIKETSYLGNSAENLSKSYNYEHLELGVGIRAKLLSKIAIDIEGLVATDEYERYEAAPLKSKEDTTHTLNASVTYEFTKNFSAGVEYSGKSKDSNDTTQTEVRHIGGLFLTYTM